MSFISCFTSTREILSGDRGETLPPETRQTYHIFTAKLKNAKAGVYPKGKPWGFTPKGIFDNLRLNHLSIDYRHIAPLEQKAEIFRFNGKPMEDRYIAT